MKVIILMPLVVSFFSGLSLAKENKNIANDLMLRYNNTIKKCSGNEAAYECSGIMIRGINQENKLPHAWSLKPGNVQKTSFSFGYLRADQQFSQFPRGYNSGFIIYPHLKTPAGKNTYKVYCAFPVDGATDGREGHGCGRSTGDVVGTSRHCDRQGIVTFSKWVSLFNSIMNSNDPNLVNRQCAFDMTLPDNGTLFDIVKNANQYIQKNSSKYYMRNNELLLHAWGQNNAKVLPIEAFFYIIGSSNGLSLAQNYQRDFYCQSRGEIVPVVGLTLAKNFNDKITITYHKSEQTVTVPSVGKSEEIFTSDSYTAKVVNIHNIMAKSSMVVKAGDQLYIAIDASARGKLWFYNNRIYDSPNYQANSMANLYDGHTGTMNVTILKGGKLSDVVGNIYEFQFAGEDGIPRTFKVKIRKL